MWGGSELLPILIKYCAITVGHVTQFGLLVEGIFHNIRCKKGMGNELLTHPWRIVDAHRFLVQSTTISQFLFLKSQNDITKN